MKRGQVIYEVTLHAEPSIQAEFDAWLEGHVREMLALPEDARAAYFDRLRKEYPVRREFPETVIRLPDGNDRLATVLNALGFVVEERT